MYGLFTFDKQWLHSMGNIPDMEHLGYLHIYVYVYKHIYECACIQPIKDEDLLVLTYLQLAACIMPSNHSHASSMCCLGAFC